MNCIDISRRAFLLILIFGVSNLCSANQSNMSDAYSIRNLLSSHKIIKVEIYEIPPDVETFSDITPDMLENTFYYKVTLSDIRGREKHLLDVLENLSGDAIDRRLDLRYGITFYGEGNSKLSAIFFDRTGEFGMINGKSLKINGKLFSWIESAFNGSINLLLR